MNEKIFIHRTADVSSDAKIGSGTKVWNNAQIREGAQIGGHCVIGKDVYIDKGVIIGSNCKIQNSVSIYNGATLGNDVFVGPHVTFTNDKLPIASNSDWVVTPTIIKNRVSLGANSTIICGVTIGESAFVGAGSVVTKDVKPNTYVLGNPARQIGVIDASGYSQKPSNFNEVSAEIQRETLTSEVQLRRSSLKNQTILIAGGAGFIGSHLVDAILKLEPKQVVIVDNLFLGNLSNIEYALGQGVVFYNEDIENVHSLNYIFENHPIDVVFNCATKALNYSFTNPVSAFNTNTNGVLNLLELLRYQKYKTLCHFSTSEVYGTAVYSPMDERHPHNPTTTYAAGKAAADLAVMSMVKMFDLDAFIVRPFNNYGPRQNHRGALSGVIPRTISRIVDRQRPEIHGTGLQKRDFIYVNDTVNATLSLYPIVPRGESVNVTANCSLAIRDVVQLTCRFMGYNDGVDYTNSRLADVKVHVGSNQKLLDWIPMNFTPFYQGLQETVAWYQDKLQ